VSSRYSQLGSQEERIPMPMQKTVLLTVAFLGFASFVSGKQNQSNKGAGNEMSGQKNFELLIPNTMPQSVGYSQVAIVTNGSLVFISGQVALDKSGSVVGRDDFRAQVQQVFENLQAAIEAAGGTFDDVIKLNSYVVDLSPAHLTEFREVRDKYVNVRNPPASTAVQVQRLFRPEFLVEIEAVAVVKNK
jgi:enamine deaminase RidA (YjgF/YER057c/UK114 family)